MSSKLRAGYYSSKIYYNNNRAQATKRTRQPKYCKPKLAPADDPARFTHGKGLRKHRKKQKRKGSRKASI